MAKVLELKSFSSIDLEDPFFDSLKKDYEGFEKWFHKKGNEQAFVRYDEDNHLQGFLYLKDESDSVDDKITPLMTPKKRLKVGTFKIDAHSTRLGERFVKKIMDKGVYEGYEEAYVTIFSKQDGLISLLKKFGFKDYGTKGEELVLVKDFKNLTGDIIKDLLEKLQKLRAESVDTLEAQMKEVQERRDAKQKEITKTEKEIWKNGEEIEKFRNSIT